MYKRIFVVCFLVVFNFLFAEGSLIKAADFLESFGGQPTNPQPLTQTGQTSWDVAIHSRNADTWDKLVPFNLHHGPNCEAPLTTSATVPFTANELVTHNWDGTYEHSVFKCNDHIMTGIFGVGRSINDSYALIALTPNRMVDFTNGPATIRWNMTTYRTTQRDWIDVWITPYDENLQLPFNSSSLGTVDLQGTPRNAVEFDMFAPNDNTKSGIRPQIFKNGANTNEFRQFTSDYNHFLGYEDYLPGKAGDPKRRDTFEITISKTHVKICMPKDPVDNAPSETICWADKEIAALPFTKGVVTFGHHSYTPNKDCNFYTPLICGPDTWHWDEVFISPAVPFKMIKADRRMVTNENTQVNFQEPAPANAKLRFSAAGSVSLSFNGGAFQSVQKQPSSLNSPTHVASYFVPIPQGTTNVRFRMSDTGAGGVHAKDFAIWSQDAPGNTPTTGVTSTVTPTKTPTVTITVKPGDANGDNKVDGVDYIAWLTHYNQNTTSKHVHGDFDASGKVDGVDYLLWLNNYGR